MIKVGILDLPGSNSMGIRSALLRIGSQPEITREKADLKNYDRLIIPGVGKFGPASVFLKDSGLGGELGHLAKIGMPILGICLGFQLLSKSSEESPGYKGLNLFNGEARQIPRNLVRRIPNIGWRRITKISSNSDFGFSIGTLFYFAHTYEVYGGFENEHIASAEYENYEFVAAMRRENLWGVQFHPEKSHDAGLAFLQSFTESAK